MPFDTPATPVPEPLRIAARDGYPLAAHYFAPIGPAKGAVLMAGAMGVPRRFYQDWAAYLAQAGLAVLTLDYRGFGESAPARLRGFESSLQIWVDNDLPAALDALASRHPGLPLLWCGHSVGGQLMGFVDTSRLAGALFIGSQSGYWKNWPTPRWRRLMWTLSHVLLPAFATALGRVPGRLMGGESLPAGVAREWAAWIRDPEYMGRLARPRQWADFHRYTGPIRLVTISDDDYAPPAAGAALLRAYRSAAAEQVLLHPADGKAKTIGHFNAFRPRFRETLWPAWRDWLLARV